LYDFLVKNDILNCNQFGFRQNVLTAHAVSEVCDTLYESVDGGNVACGIFLDLAKAFNTINHKILAYKAK